MHVHVHFAEHQPWTTAKRKCTTTSRDDDHFFLERDAEKSFSRFKTNVDRLRAVTIHDGNHRQTF